MCVCEGERDVSTLRLWSEREREGERQPFAPPCLVAAARDEHPHPHPHPHSHPYDAALHEAKRNADQALADAHAHLQAVESQTARQVLSPFSSLPPSSPPLFPPSFLTSPLLSCVETERERDREAHMHRRIMKCTAVMMTCIPAHTLYCSFRDDTLAQDARRPCERARSRARARSLSLSLSLSRSRSLSRSHDTRARTHRQDS